MQMNNNLKKFTKAELINRINNDNKDQIESRSFFNKFKSYLSSFWTLLLKLKSIIGKLTLITFFLQLFRKYSIIRRIWQILNSIIVTIFGISFIDSFGFEFMNNFIIEIRLIIAKTVDYLTNTHFYIFLSKLFLDPSSENQSKPNKSGSMISEISRETPNDQRKTSESIRQSNRNSKISEWLKPEEKPEIPDESSNNKYYYFLGLIVVSALAWYYFDEIKTNGSSILEWIKSFRGDNDPGNNNQNNLQVENRISQRAELERMVREKTKETNEKLSDIIDNSGSSSKTVRILSPSLENLNEKVTESWNEATSPTSSTSSTETIKPSSSKIKSDGVFPLSDNFLDNSKITTDSTALLNIKDNWKNIIKSDLKQSIEYVETHLPRNELDDTGYLNGLLDEINRKNINFMKELNLNSKNIKLSKLIYLKDIGKNVDNWIDEMRKEISKFE
jgi:hypothetical protein